MQYPQRVSDSTYIPTFFFADEDEHIHVHHVFMLLYRLIYGIDKDIPELRDLLCAAFRLYGWKNTPLYAAVRNQDSTIDEIKKARAQRFDESGEAEILKGVRIFWSYHDSLLRVPMSWYRPGILEGDVICHHMFRYEDRKEKNPVNPFRKGENPILPSLEDTPYVDMRKNLQEVGSSSLKMCQDIERVFVELYGGVERTVITVGDIIQEAPNVQEKYFMSWDCF